MSLFEDQAPRPLADRLRPQHLSEVVGQGHLLSAGAPIGRMVAQHRLASMILWGPPGCGKTTIARLLADATAMHFEPLSAVFSGVADLRKVFDAAKKRRLAGQGTLYSTSLSGIGSLNVTAYAVKTASGLNIVAVNKDSAQNLQLTIQLPQSAAAP